MVDLMPIIYVSLIGLGLIGAQAALSDKRFMLVLSAPPQLANTGYSRDVIEDLFLSDMEDVFDTRSVIATPTIASVREKTILGTMAEIAHMGDLAFVIQQKIGGNPYKVTANFVVEGNKTQVLLSGNSANQGQFQQVIVGGDGDFRSLIRRAALEATRNIDPYFRALFEFEQDQRRNASSFAYVESLIEEELRARKATFTPLRHSAFLNLRGLMCLEKDDKACALAAFNAALAADPKFAIARLNRAFTLVELDRYQDAIDEANYLLGPPPKTDMKPCLAAARTLIGVAKWALGDIAGAQVQFSEASALSPKFETPLIYWSRMLAAINHPNKELEGRLAAREMDTAHIELYSEIAMLYFWLNEKNNQPIVRRKVPPIARKISEAPTSHTR